MTTDLEVKGPLGFLIRNSIAVFIPAIVLMVTGRSHKGHYPGDLGTGHSTEIHGLILMVMWLE